MSSTEKVYAGIDIGGTNIKFGLFNSQGKILHREHRLTMAEKGPEVLMHLVTNIAERLLLFAAEEELDVRHLGVGTPGAVDFKTGQVIGLCPNIKGWQGTQIGKILTERLNMPVWVDNDVNCMALAESKFGAAAGGGTTVCLTLGTGVGGAILLDGKLHRGATYSAGELGHMSIESNGQDCSCGNRGCLEVYVASSKIVARVRALLNSNMTDLFERLLEGKVENLNVRKIFSAFKGGDEVATKILSEVASQVATALAGVVNLINPNCVVIGGGIAEGDHGFVAMIDMEIRQRAFETATNGMTVVRAALGNDAGFIGAGLLGEMR
ncbi:MAG: ROK family protein [bacterium]|nr:ROK family protein [bacterium]